MRTTSIGSRWVRAQLVPSLALMALGATLGLTIWQWDAHKSIVSAALHVDDLSLVLNLALVAGFCWRYNYPRRELFKRIHDGAIGEIRAALGR